jgi:phospholipase A1
MIKAIQNKRDMVFRSGYLFIVCLLMSMFALNAGMVSAADENEDDLPARYAKKHDAFHSYLPTYIGWTASHSDSTREGELKLQFSVKYEVLDETDWYFGYTQKSFWSIQKESSPFRETNYAPELFSIYKRSGLSWLPVIQAGIYRHESTGESGVGSHGWDITYIEPAFYWKGLYIITSVWVPSIVQGFDEKKAAPDNPDIFRYFGYGKLSAIYGNKDLQIALSLQYAPIDHGITWEGQADVSWKSIAETLNSIFGFNHAAKWNPYYFIQARNGYGEGLKTYNVKTSSIVLGISLVR